MAKGILALRGQKTEFELSLQGQILWVGGGKAKRTFLARGMAHAKVWQGHCAGCATGKTDTVRLQSAAAPHMSGAEGMGSQVRPTDSRKKIKEQAG